MLTGVIKKKDILDIKRAESIHGVESKVLNDETLLSLNQDGNIYLNNILTELENLESKTTFKSTLGNCVIKKINRTVIVHKER